MVDGFVAGALGAFLAPPVASSVKAVFSQYAAGHRRYFLAGGTGPRGYSRCCRMRWLGGEAATLDGDAATTQHVERACDWLR